MVNKVSEFIKYNNWLQKEPYGTHELQTEMGDKLS